MQGSEDAGNGPERKAFTDRWIRSVQPSKPGQRRTVWDTILPGFGLRISDRVDPTTGVGLSFVVMRRLPGASAPTRATIGRYHPTALPLAKAREQARRVIEQLAGGKKPAEEKKRRQREEAERCSSSFGAVAEDFIKRHAMTKRSGRMVAGIVRRELVPVWGERSIAEITRRDVIKLVEAILDRGGDKPVPGSRRKAGGPYAARHALSAARRLFNWSVGRDLIERSPCDRVKAAELHGAPEARSRVLADDELRRVWRAAEATPYPFGPLVQLLILTGQRRDEIAGARWGEIDFDAARLTIGADRMKAKAGHVVPLSAPAVDILRELPRFVAGDYLFSGLQGDRPFSGFSKAKARLDKVIGDIAPYTLHDIRRTVRTRLAELGVSPFVGELVIAHTQRGVHAIYDLHRYEAEKRQALDRWAAKLTAIVEPPPANVVNMAGRRKRKAAR